MAESLKEARDREAADLCRQLIGLAPEVACPSDLADIESTMRELQRQAMEVLIEHIGGIEFVYPDPNSQYQCRGWVVQGEEGRVWADGDLTIDELLDGPAPGGKGR